MHKHEKYCMRYRSCRLDVDHLGVMAPVYFLGAWLSRSHDFPSREAHKKFRPSRKEMEEFRAQCDAGIV